MTVGEKPKREPSWLATELEDCFPGQVSRPPGFPGELALNGVSIDSRSVQAGDLFIALKGDPGPRFGGGDRADARDGNAFVSQAVTAGASAIMVSQKTDEKVLQIRLDQTLDGLWQPGAAARSRTSARCIASTGSSGKTTLRHWLETICSAFDETHTTNGSLNNHWGVPLSQARIPRETRLGVFEVATNHPGEIAPLSRMVDPDISVLLNVLPAHIGNCGAIAALTQEKRSKHAS